MIRFVFCVLLLVGIGAAQNPDIKSARHIKTQVYHDGKLTTVIRQTDPTDTMRVWSTHAGRRHAPSFPPDKATHVLWCRSDLYPHGSHLFPNSKTVYRAQHNGYVYWMTSEGLKTVNNSMDGSLNYSQIGH
jgi:hypothetical protein